MGWQMGLPSIVLIPYAGAHNLFGIGYHSRPVEALSECIFDQGSGRGVVTIDPTVDIAQHKLAQLDRDTELQDPGVALFVEFTLYKNEGFGTTCEPLSLCLVRR